MLRWGLSFITGPRERVSDADIETDASSMDEMSSVGAPKLKGAIVTPISSPKGPSKGNIEDCEAKVQAL